MNDTMAIETIEKHKYLLLEVQNRAAIAYFAAANRNMSLYHALKNYITKKNSESEDLSLLSSSNSESNKAMNNKKDEEKLKLLMSEQEKKRKAQGYNEKTNPNGLSPDILEQLE